MLIQCEKMSMASGGRLHLQRASVRLYSILSSNRFMWLLLKEKNCKCSFKWRQRVEPKFQVQLQCTYFSGYMYTGMDRHVTDLYKPLAKAVQHLVQKCAQFCQGTSLCACVNEPLDFVHFIFQFSSAINAKFTFARKRRKKKKTQSRVPSSLQNTVWGTY